MREKEKKRKEGRKVKEKRKGPGDKIHFNK